MRVMGEGESSKTIILKQGWARTVKGEQSIIIVPTVCEQIALLVPEEGEPKKVGIDLRESWSHALGVTEYEPVLVGSIPFNKAEGILLKQAAISNSNNKGKSLQEIGASLRAKNIATGKMAG